jgi:hypothetical protein
MAELRGQLRHGHTLAQLYARVAVAEVMRVEVRDSGRLAGAGDHVLCGVGREAWEHSPLGSAVVRRLSKRFNPADEDLKERFDRSYCVEPPVDACAVEARAPCYAVPDAVTSP